MPRVVRQFPAPKRGTEWSSVLARSEVQGVSTGQTLGDTAVAAEATVRQTVVRHRGHALCHMIAGAASDSMLVGLGLVIISADAFAAGAASLPSPLEDAAYPFFWHQLFVLGPAQAAETVAYSMLTEQRVEIDSKAQRKLQPGQTIAFIWDGFILAGSPTFDGFAAIRTLSLLA